MFINVTVIITLSRILHIFVLAVQRRRFGVFIVNFEHTLHFFGVSIVDFEQVNVGWVISLKNWGVGS